jgi:hypothetical protein
MSPGDLAHLDHQTLLPGGRWSGRGPARTQPQDPSPSWQRRTEQLLQPSEPGRGHPQPMSNEWPESRGRAGSPRSFLAAEVIATGPEYLVQAR